MCRRSGCAESGSGANESTEDRWDVTLLRISSATLVGSFEMASSRQNGKSNCVIFCGLCWSLLRILQSCVYFSERLYLTGRRSWPQTTQKVIPRMDSPGRFIL